MGPEQLTIDALVARVPVRHRPRADPGNKPKPRRGWHCALIANRLNGARCASPGSPAAWHPAARLNSPIATCSPTPSPADSLSSVVLGPIVLPRHSPRSCRHVSSISSEERDSALMLRLAWHNICCGAVPGRWSRVTSSVPGSLSGLSTELRIGSCGSIRLSRCEPRCASDGASDDPVDGDPAIAGHGACRNGSSRS